MPYIPFDQRAEVNEQYRAGRGIQEPGELAYVIADALDQFVGTQYRFDRLAAALGALESAKAEFYERVVEPYERIKRQENGEVFTLSNVTGGPE